MEDIFSADVRDNSRFNIDSSDDEDVQLAISTPSKVANLNENKFGNLQRLEEMRSDTSARSSFLRAELHSSHENTLDIVNEIAKFFEDSEASIANPPSKKRESKEEAANNEKPQATEVEKEKASDEEVEKMIKLSSNRRSSRLAKQQKQVKKRVQKVVVENLDELPQMMTRSAARRQNRLESDEDSTPEKQRKRRRSKRKSSKKATPKDQGGSNDGIDSSLPIDEDRVLCLKCVVVDRSGNVIKDARLDKVYINSNETLGTLANKFGDLFNVEADLHSKVKVLIDGDSQNHETRVGDRALALEDGTQIDIVFPPLVNESSQDPEACKPSDSASTTPPGRVRWARLVVPTAPTTNVTIDID